MTLFQATFMYAFSEHGFGFAIPKGYYSEGPLFWKFTIPTNPKAGPKLNPNANPKLNLNPDGSTVARICTVDFWNSGPVPSVELPDLGCYLSFCKTLWIMLLF